MSDTQTGKKASFLSLILGIYVLVVGVGQPIVFRDRYFDILSTKYYFYWISTVIMLALSLIYFFVKRDTAIFNGVIKKKLLLQDYAVLIFILVAVVSTLTSDYLYESFWGNEGRLTGLFLLSLYVLSYFFVSRFWIHRYYYIDGILVAGMFVCLFGITDYFQMDIFHFRKDVLTDQMHIFTSTIGNINAYTSYVGMITAISTVLFATIKEKKKIIFYYLCMIISFFAIIMGISDNAYLSLAALFGFLPLYLFPQKRGVKKYLIILTTFFSVVQITAWINNYFNNIVIEIDSLFNIIADSKVLLYLIGVLLILIRLLCIVENKRGPLFKQSGKWFQRMWMGLIFLVVLFTVYTLYEYNVSGNAQQYGTIGTYFVFNDEWGTHRGYIWRNAIEQFCEFSLWKKLVGFGPETFGILLMHKTYNNPYNEIFDAAHNEYLQFLLTVGIIGVSSYVMFILAYIKKCFSCGDKNPYKIAIVFGVICYSIQAFVNLNVPVVAPIFWLLLGMGTSLSINNNYK